MPLLFVKRFFSFLYPSIDALELLFGSDDDELSVDEFFESDEDEFSEPDELDLEIIDFVAPIDEEDELKPVLFELNEKKQKFSQTISFANYPLF